MDKKLKIINIVCLISYFIFLIWLLLLKQNYTISTIKALYKPDYHGDFVLHFTKWEDGYFHLYVIDIIENILIFVPLGALLLISFKNIKWYYLLIIAILLPILIELTQYFSHIGVGDIKDIITNTSGSIIGYISALILYKHINKKAFTIIQIIINALTILIIIFFIFQKIFFGGLR